MRFMILLKADKNTEAGAVCLTAASVSRGTEGLQTRLWREVDSNFRFRVRNLGMGRDPLLDVRLALLGYVVEWDKAGLPTAARSISGPWIPGIQGSIPEPQRAENLPASADLRRPQLVAGICVPGDAIALRQLLERSGPASSALGAEDRLELPLRLLPCLRYRLEIEPRRPRSGAAPCSDSRGCLSRRR